MKRYNNKISFTQNGRGVWDLDTVKGCKYGMSIDGKGCYSNCYAYLAAHQYGYDFSNSTLRRFESDTHLENTINAIKNIRSKFVRIGVMGDPSECWGHTIDICDKIKFSGKRIVIITKHWETLPSYLYSKVKSLNLIINTSISALDNESLLKNRLNEYNKLKSICTSVLRVVSCDFNLNSIRGIIYNGIQNSLFNNENVIDTVLRVSSNHPLVEQLVINVERQQFLSSKTTISKKNNEAFLGYCSSCKDKCGVNFSHTKL